MKRFQKDILINVIAIAAVCGVPAVAVAQTAAPEPQTPEASPPAPVERNDGGTTSQGDIIVTATKRSESIQRVPIAITALTAADLAVRGIQSPTDLARLVPSLSFGTQQNNPGVTMDVAIRGVSSPNSLPGGDPGVPIHMNGHYLQAANFLARDFLDVERVEVLRGPQGTLYGRNANGGSVNIITKQPTAKFEGLVSVEAGNYGMFGGQAVLNVPVSEGIRSRFAFGSRTRQGYIENVNPDAPQRDIMSLRYYSARGQIDVDVVDALTLKFGGYFYRNKGQLTPYQLTSFGPINTATPYYAALPAGSRYQSDVDKRTVSYDQRLDGRDNAHGVSLDGDWDLGPVLLRVLTAYNFSETEAPLDLDNTSVAGVRLNFTNYVRYKTKTAEAQLVSNTVSSFKWIVGANYYKENSFLTNPFSSAPSVFGVFVYQAPYADYTAEAVGVFGNAEYAISEKLSLFGGLRYNRDKKNISETNITVYDLTLIPDPTNVLAIPRDPNGFPLFNEGASFTNVNFRAGANYFVRDGAMIYASIATGYRPGGFNADATSSSRYEKEETMAYELGFKGSFLDRRATLNVSAFLTSYKDRQEALTVGTIIPPAPGSTIPGVDFRSLFVNVPKSRVYGLELETSYSASDALRFDLSVGYIRGEITSDFIGADLFRQELGLNNNFKGNQLPWTPRIKTNLGVQYDKEVSADFGFLSARVDYSYSASQYSEYFNRTPQNTRPRAEGIISDFIPSNHLVNMTLGWRRPSSGLRLDVTIANLLNDSSITSIKPSFQASLGANANWVDYRPPRFASVKLTKQF